MRHGFLFELLQKNKNAEHFVPRFSRFKSIQLFDAVHPAADEWAKDEQ